MKIADEEGYIYEVSFDIIKQVSKTHEKDSIEYVDAIGRLLDMFKSKPHRFYADAFKVIGHVNTRSSKVYV